MNYLFAIFIDAVAGVCSGLFGIGGGIVIIPMLLFLMKFSQQAATGTSLVALLLPVGGLGVWQFYKSGFINSENIKFGLLISVGMIVGTWVGAKFAVGIDEKILSKTFSIFLFLISLKIWFK